MALPENDPECAILPQGVSACRSFRANLQIGLTISVLIVSATACDAELVIGTFACAQSSTLGAKSDTGTTTNPLSIPWSTSFEDGFTDYAANGDHCYSEGSATYKVVNNPVHSGRSSAAFSVSGDGSMLNTQARCVRQGTLPQQAYYGAWYFIPAATKNNSIWNLLHFQGGESSNDTLHGIWDISLVNANGGGLKLDVYDFLRQKPADMVASPKVPIGSWFHIEVFLRRAANDCGDFALYQDGTTVLQMSGVATDDTQWGQWLIGNLAIDLEPDQSTLFVDDVSISATR